MLHNAINLTVSYTVSMSNLLLRDFRAICLVLFLKISENPSLIQIEIQVKRKILNEILIVCLIFYQIVNKNETEISLPQRYV